MSVPKNTLTSFRNSNSRHFDLNRTQYSLITEEAEKRYSIDPSSRSRKSNAFSNERPIVAYEVSVGSGTTMRDLLQAKHGPVLGPTEYLPLSSENATPEVKERSHAMATIKKAKRMS